MNDTIVSRLDALRAEMKKANVQIVIIPQTDPHLGEYLSSHWQVRRFLSGFTGSAGSLVVTANEALLWTDSRYFIQAADQLRDTGIVLMKDGLPETPSIAQWICTHSVKGDTVGIDGWVFSIGETAELEKSLSKAGVNLKTDLDIIDNVWKDRPALPQDKIFIHDVRYAGVDAADKIKAVLKNGQDAGAKEVFISALDEIAWILNLRSSDVSCNPVLTSFLFLSPAGSTLFTDISKVTPEVETYLAERNVKVAPYSSVAGFLAGIAAEGNHTVLVDLARNSGAVKQLLGSSAVLTSVNPVAMLKGVKNNVQIEGTRNAMRKDGAALVGAFREIEEKVAAGTEVTELDVAEILTRHRSAQPLYFDNSFETIAGYGAHGAIVHYSATEESSVRIGTDSLLLVDSGAQYLDGTTDITRTVALGTPTEMQKRDFTLVMKGHIALGSQIFPEGTRGDQLDSLARQFLWMNGLSYLHGTGHGVGHFLNVHEGPQSIRLNHVNTPLTPGMITSNEPGLYRENIHGIRCENLVLTVPAMTTEFGNFYKFETLTLFPFDLRLFDTSIMTDSEIEWLNNYHATVRERLLPLLGEEDSKWLIEKTEPLKR